MNPTRGILVAGNWKMNHAPAGTHAFFQDLHAHMDPAVRAALGLQLRGALFVPAISLATGLEGRGSLPLFIGAQNVHWEKAGAFTGEISGPMLTELGVSWALVGHSERRQFFAETDETARKRAESLLEQGFTVVLCVGETRAEREAGQTEAILTRQLDGALPGPGIGAAAFLDGRLILAYEPVWAIGTGLTATPEQAEEAHAFLRGRLHQRFGLEAASKTPILYGGSVTPENFESLLQCPNVDGGLVGGASLKAHAYNALLKTALLALS